MASILESVTDGLTITRYADWLVFTERLRELVRSGKIRTITPLKSHHFAKGDEWYLDPETGEIYVHGVPGAPSLPSWERFDAVAHTQPPVPHPNNLTVIPLGSMGSVETRSTKTILGLLAHQGMVEMLEPQDAAKSQGVAETWYKDTQTGVVYRLVEKGGEDNRWEMVPQNELRLRVQ